jgi:hypothetical protein
VNPALIKYVAIAVATLTLLFGVYMKGRHDVQVKFDQYKAEVKAAADEQARESAKVDAHNKKLFTDAQNAYNTSLTNLRTYYSLRYAKGGSTLPKISATPAGVNDYSPDNLPPTPILAGQCAETTLNLIALQKFVTDAANNYE